MATREMMRSCAELSLIDTLHELAQIDMEFMPAGFTMNLRRKNISSNIFSDKRADHVDRSTEELKKIDVIGNAAHVMFLEYQDSQYPKEGEYFKQPWDLFAGFIECLGEDDNAYFRLHVDDNPRFYEILIDGMTWKSAARDLGTGKFLEEQMRYEKFQDCYRPKWEQCGYEMIIFLDSPGQFWNILDDMVPGTLDVSNERVEWYRVLRTAEVVPPKRVLNMLLEEKYYR